MAGTRGARRFIPYDMEGAPLNVAQASCRPECQCGTIYAMPFAGRPGAVVEDMAQMSAATAAMGFGAGHADLVIGAGSDSLG